MICLILFAQFFFPSTNSNLSALLLLQDNALSEINTAQYLVSDDHQKATVVTATLVNLLSNELSLKPLVKRVNEDLRRDDMRVGPELELRYFDILSRILQYNRLKLADEYKEFLSASAAGATTAAGNCGYSCLMLCA